MGSVAPARRPRSAALFLRNLLAQVPARKLELVDPLVVVDYSVDNEQRKDRVPGRDNALPISALVAEGAGSRPVSEFLGSYAPPPNA
jgi:hypothetical protein